MGSICVNVHSLIPSSNVLLLLLLLLLLPAPNMRQSLTMALRYVHDV
jgi:hypothetical protein